MYYNDSTEKRVKIFEDTMRMCKSNKQLADAISSSIKGTKLYPADMQLEVMTPAREVNTIVSVTKERTFEAAGRLYKEFPDKKITVLNFASATNPGGGVINGASAQEECLCRCSTLYPCLKTKTAFDLYYSVHRRQKDPLYSDACIYTPDVKVVKTDTMFPEPLPETEWFNVNIITCAAPNLRARSGNTMNPGRNNPAAIGPANILTLHKSRATRILDVAAENGTDILVLGAFGCGAFMNDPRLVARAYKEVLQKYPARFERIVFAVYCSARDAKNFDAFNSILR